ncbi:MFS transporter [Kitasatospora atroaurantiaca]|uniref:Putative MFS family arabinose efflux permease n=1 Tax=Kitasatospora atroaurantiaca TaxID=285545 RepID=A0A561EID5_9ACTN|nr:MFS transporter [Kitasatospora atroaurantiaca]TWE15379.1 putative MFS family arabinose efflux permease [Kitasatospora atroaurantiaca]
MSSLRTFADRLVDSYLPPSRDGRIFATTVVIHSAGTGLYLAGGTVYFLRGIGLSAAQVGIGLTVAGLIGFFTTVPVSMLGNRFGALRMLRMLQVWRAVWFTALAFADNAVTFILFASLLAMAQGPTTPMTQMVVGTIADEADRTKTFAVMRSVSNVGFTLGALAAAPLLTVGNTWTFRAILLLDALSFLFAAGLLGRLRIRTGAPESKRAPWRQGALAVFRNRSYAALTVTNGVLFLHTTLLSIGLPLWVIQNTEAPAGLLGVLLTINTVLAITLQVHLAKRVKTSRDGTRALRNTGLVLAACCAVLATTAGLGGRAAVPLLILAVVLLTLGELWQAVGSWELSYRHAPEEERAAYLSVFSLGGSAVGIVGPALLALVVAGGTAGLLGLTAVFLVAAGAVTAIGSALERAEAAPVTLGGEQQAAKTGN